MTGPNHHSELESYNDSMRERGEFCEACETGDVSKICSACEYQARVIARQCTDTPPEPG